MNVQYMNAGDIVTMCREKMERSTSPAPLISKALFKNLEGPKSTIKPKRPSIDDDYQRVESSSSTLSTGSKHSNRRKSSTINLDSDGRKSRRLSNLENKENNPQKNQLSVPAYRVRPRGLSERDTNVFRFSHVESPGDSVCRTPLSGVPRITILPDNTVQQESAACQDSDDVFWDNLEVPSSSRLLLTPSTTYSPRPSSCTSLHLEYSPNIDLGIQCNTPSRLKIEMEGLGSEKLVLGRGAYGTVVLGQFRGHKCAVKVMEKEQGGGVSARRRKSLESELQALKLDHDNIVKVHGVFAAEDRYSVIIMEYVGSRNLHRLLIETPEKFLGRSWLLGVGRQVSSAIAHCHSRGVVHMDIKPANVLVTSSGGIKLGDFGCSVGVDSGDVPLDHSLVGTPGYQAPEFLRGGLPQPACDVYSLGVLLWQLDAREIPFQGQHPQTIMFRTVSCGARPPNPSAPFVNVPAFGHLYKLCWSSEASHRPSASSVHTRLCNVASALPSTKKTTTTFSSTTTLRL